MGQAFAQEEPVTKTIRVRYHEGKLEPLEPLAMEEGAEVTVTLTRPADPHQRRSIAE